MKDHADTVDKFLKASQESIDYINKNPEDTAKIINKAIGVKEDVTLKTLKGYKFEIGFPQGALDDLNQVNEWAYKNGNYKTTFDIKDYIDADEVKKLYPEQSDAKL